MANRKSYGEKLGWWPGWYDPFGQIKVDTFINIEQQVKMREQMKGFKKMSEWD